MIMEIDFEDEQSSADAFAFILHGRFNFAIQAYDNGFRLFGEEEIINKYLLIVKHIRHKTKVIENE